MCNNFIFFIRCTWVPLPSLYLRKVKPKACRRQIVVHICFVTKIIILLKKRLDVLGKTDHLFVPQPAWLHSGWGLTTVNVMIAEEQTACLLKHDHTKSLNDRSQDAYISARKMDRRPNRPSNTNRYNRLWHLTFVLCTLIISVMATTSYSLVYQRQSITESMLVLHVPFLRVSSWSENTEVVSSEPWRHESDWQCLNAWLNIQTDGFPEPERPVFDKPLLSPTPTWYALLMSLLACSLMLGISGSEGLIRVVTSVGPMKLCCCWGHPRSRPGASRSECTGQ